MLPLTKSFMLMGLSQNIRRTSFLFEDFVTNTQTRQANDNAKKCLVIMQGNFTSVASFIIYLGIVYNTIATAHP